MNALTPAERQRLIDMGLISFSKQKNPTVIPVAKEKKKRYLPKPKPFEGTPNERAEKAVEYARTGLYAIGECAIACGYLICSAATIKELMVGHGPAIDAVKNAAKTGNLDWEFKNRASLKIVRDLYGIEKVHGERDPDNQALREAIIAAREHIYLLAMDAELSPLTIRDFIGKNFRFMKKVNREKLWKSLRDRGLLK